MDFELSEELMAARELAREFAEFNNAVQMERIGTIGSKEPCYGDYDRQAQGA